MLFEGRELAVSWALCAVCLVGHFSHFFAAKAPWIHVFHSIGFHLSLSLFTLLGPGRQLILDGLKSLLKRTPNMNTLVGLGALSSFTVSSFAALLPRLVKCLFGVCYLQPVILDSISCWLHLVTHLSTLVEYCSILLFILFSYKKKNNIYITWSGWSPSHLTVISGNQLLVSVDEQHVLACTY